MYHKIEVPQISILDIPCTTYNLTQVKHYFTYLFTHEKNVPHQIVTLNSLMVNHSVTDLTLRQVLQNSTLNLPDSVGILYAVKMLGAKIPQLIPGIELVYELCTLAALNQYRVYLLGSTSEIVYQTKTKLESQIPGLIVAGYQHGYFNPDEEKDVITQINQTQTDILFVARTVPEQEKWIARILPHLKTTIVIGIGGSFDVISGKLSRAPKFIRSLGIEWMYRLYLQPWRVKRIIRLPQFFVRVITYTIKLKFNRLIHIILR